jgi:hypothetical protein
MRAAGEPRAHSGKIELCKPLFSANPNLQCLWTDAIRHACYMRKRCMATGAGDSIPFELLIGSKADLSELRVWHSPAWAAVLPEQQLAKLNSRPELGRYVRAQGGCLVPLDTILTRWLPFC